MSRHPCGATRCGVRGEVDISTEDVLRTAVERALATQPAVIVDLTEVTFLASAGVRVLLDAGERSRPDQFLAVVTGPATQTVVRLCGLADLAFCFPDLDTAAAAYRRARAAHPGPAVPG
ncbi:STAS domain-containing protein [Pseudonocardia acidicola]|uniref:STAS domain-containing protein n=1 Tax=Pseudonocardia acidicola TaxID=2724939 RepID=A0ABX1SJM8_9PSEU|nr:STAS domain-containing protein [Pseudonocardia acidicola]